MNILIFYISRNDFICRRSGQLKPTYSTRFVRVNWMKVFLNHLSLIFFSFISKLFSSKTTSFIGVSVNSKQFTDLIHWVIFESTQREFFRSLFSDYFPFSSFPIGHFSFSSSPQRFLSSTESPATSLIVRTQFIESTHRFISICSSSSKLERWIFFDCFLQFLFFFFISTLPWKSTVNNFFGTFFS